MQAHPPRALSIPAPVSVKTCTKCSETKPLSAYSKNRDGINGPILHSHCTSCRSARALQWFHDNKDRHRETQHRWNLKVTYGITPEEYEEMLLAQQGVCAICGQDEPNEHGRTGTKFRLSVDHDHVTGRVRGLLCQKCNRAIGLLGDNVALLRKAIDYLERK